jgi:16S rRNA (guanine966-N2)-methyltransferase
MDMVREAAFSALGELIVDARVLDLFAGSGAYGIEALSRGAADAVFVDNHPKSIETIRLNLSKTKLCGKVIRQDVFRFLRDHEEAFRIAFADPPYAKDTGSRDYVGELLNNERLPALVQPGGLLVLEHVATAKIEPSPYWKVTRAKRYGTAELLFLTHD